MALAKIEVAVVNINDFEQRMEGILRAQEERGREMAEVANAARRTLVYLVAGLTVLLLVGLAAVARADEAPKPAFGSLELTETNWAVFTRGERREFMGGRAVLQIHLPASWALIARADMSGAQDGGSLDVEDPQSYRSVEAFVGGKRSLGDGLAVAALVGTVYDVDRGYDPADTSRHSVLLLFRVPLPSGGYAYVGGGHRGPVGGAAAVASIKWVAGPTRLAIDYDLPFARAADGAVLPWVLKLGVEIPVRTWELR